MNAKEFIHALELINKALGIATKHAQNGIVDDCDPEAAEEEINSVLDDIIYNVDLITDVIYGAVSRSPEKQKILSAEEAMLQAESKQLLGENINSNDSSTITISGYGTMVDFGNESYSINVPVETEEERLEKEAKLL